ncbi:TIGR04372 family glycosyltransferase [Nisaea acidiphila]|uniref:TIGR04372 family glycosyltransferase n=1 Tax=Nisaea acidiphila TaxID=1862145 RepID=A0A9J7AP39_9PROT|nr:TIGR04372 family glycosyltransferase [Nisaea acidiphila]UUX48108.1 TIGR04372 family glycosyltransferase [Nisaea acidiphila]
MNDQSKARAKKGGIVRFNPRPVRIFASLTSRNLGDLVGQHIAAASIKHLFNTASLLAEATVATAIQRTILGYNQHIDCHLELPRGHRVPMAAFDVHSGALTVNSEEWNRLGGRFTNVFLAGYNVGVEIIPSLPYKARFAYPESKIDQSSQILKDRGLDPDRWFTVIHWREPGYLDRPDEILRDVKDVSSFHDTIRHIIAKQGGQVVRIGHHGSSQLPNDLGNVIDLSDIPDSFDLQCFAISRARYFIGSCTGPNVLGSAFGTPSLITNQLGADAVWNPDDICLTQTLRTGDGQLLTGEQFFRAGFLHHGLLKNKILKSGKGFELFQNTAEEIIRCADLMYEKTEGCSGWRIPDPVGTLPAKRPNYMPQPLQPAFNTSLFADNQ